MAIRNIVGFSVHYRTLAALCLGLLVIAGGFAFSQLNIEAYPDPVPPLVGVITQSPGLSAEEVERYITIPVETTVAGLPFVKAMRTTSVFGLSDVKIQFTYDITYEQAMQNVLNRLGTIDGLPANAQPQISPVSPIGEIMRYQIKGPPGTSLADLRTVQDWVVQRRFKAVPGVVDVTAFGGKLKTYEIIVDFNKLLAYGLTMPQVVDAVRKANLNVGGNTVNIGVQSGIVRGVGVIRSVDDIGATLITQSNGQPVRVRDVARIEIGNQPRLGIVGRDQSDDIVEGIVLMRRGEKSMPTILRVAAELKKLNESGVLPSGVQIDRIYDRKDLIDLTTSTVEHSLLMGFVLILLLQWIFLGDLRSAIVVAATIPVSLSVAVLVMVIRGESANLLSVGAIDFGLIVDASVIMVEGIYRHLLMAAVGVSTAAMSAQALRDRAISRASDEIMGGILFSFLIIIVAFLPLFTLTGVEGYIFGPMARTYAYALLGGLFAAFTFTPALASLLFTKTAAPAGAGGHAQDHETPVVRFLSRYYQPMLVRAVHGRKKTLGVAAVILVLSLVAARLLGLEFLPKLEEGNMWVRATLPASISLDEGNTYVNTMRKLIAEAPEVISVLSHQGRPDDGTDVAGFNNVEIFVPLKPQTVWRKGMTKPKLIAEIRDKLEDEFAGIEFNFSQYLEDNVAEAASGVKGENSVKLFVNDLREGAQAAKAIKAVLAAVPGVEDLAVFNAVGQPTLEIVVDREMAGRYGLMPDDITTAIRTAVAGESPGNLLEPDSDRRFPIIIRLAPEYRGTPEAIGNLRIGVVGSDQKITQIPLREVAIVRLTSGPAAIYREGQERYIPIKFSVRGRDLGSTVAEAQARVAKEVALPPRARLEWAGEFGNLQQALARLMVIIPLTLFLIGLILFVYLNNLVDTLITLSMIPLAMVGGFFMLFITGTPLGVSAIIGFIALFGIAVMDGIMIITHLNRLVEEGQDTVSAVIDACTIQMRPVVMTCTAACVGLVPAALSSGIGSEVQRPLAFVVVGGMLIAPFLILIVLPALLATFSNRKPPMPIHDAAVS